MRTVILSKKGRRLVDQAIDEFEDASDALNVGVGTLLRAAGGYPIATGSCDSIRFGLLKHMDVKPAALDDDEFLDEEAEDDDEESSSEDEDDPEADDEESSSEDEEDPEDDDEDDLEE